MSVPCAKDSSGSILGISSTSRLWQCKRRFISARGDVGSRVNMINLWMTALRTSAMQSQSMKERQSSACTMAMIDAQWLIQACTGKGTPLTWWIRTGGGAHRGSGGPALRRNWCCRCWRSQWLGCLGRRPGRSWSLLLWARNGPHRSGECSSHPSMRLQSWLAPRLPLRRRWGCPIAWEGGPGRSVTGWWCGGEKLLQYLPSHLLHPPCGTTGGRLWGLPQWLRRIFPWRSWPMT